METGVFQPGTDDSCQIAPIPPALLPGWNSLGTGLNGTVRAIILNGSDIYVGGNFTNAGGIASADYVARWDGSAWHEVAAGLTGQVYALAFDAGGNLYVGGSFTDAGGNSNADRIAMWDGSSWQALNAGVGNYVSAIAVIGSDVFVGGGFGTIDGIANTEYIARWDGSSWNALGTGTGLWVENMAVNGSDLYVTGGFYNVGGDPNADGVVRWDGTSWHALGTGGMTFWADAIAISGNNVYVGGGFLDAGGIANADYIARFDGTSWNALGTGTNGSVFAIVVDGSDVYVGGTYFNGANNSNISRWNGSAWNPLQTGLSSSVFAALKDGNNLFLGGDFLNAGNANGDRIVRWDNTPLPVELSSFDAKQVGKAVLLSWQTQSESYNDYFLVEHSTNLGDFQTIGKVPGNGSSSAIHDYALRHEEPAKGWNYYRLQQRDWSGEIHYSKIAGVLIPEENTTIFPNPAADELTIEGADAAFSQVKIIDVMGRVVLEHDCRLGTSIPLDNCSPGLYVVEISINQQITRHKLIKK